MKGLLLKTLALLGLFAAIAVPHTDPFDVQVALTGVPGAGTVDYVLTYQAANSMEFVDITTLVAGVVDHGTLLGLADDDHTQYLLADGTRALTGTWSAANEANFTHLGVGAVSLPMSNYRSLEMRGTDASGAGPHLWVNTDGDVYPQVHLLSWTHDNVALMFDMYFDGVWKSSDVGSNFKLYKVSDTLRIQYGAGNAQGASFVPTNGWWFTTGGAMRFPEATGVPLLQGQTDTNTGISFGGSDRIYFFEGGAVSNQINASSQFLLSDGSQTTPGVSFISDPNTGMYSYTADGGALAAGGVWKIAWSNDANDVRFNTQARGVNGSQTEPTFGFTGDTNTGMYWKAADELAFTAAGQHIFYIDGDATPGLYMRNISLNSIFGFASSTNSAPAFSATDDTNTGTYFPAADQVAWTAGGTLQAGAVGSGTTGLYSENHYPITSASDDLGSASIYWDDINYKDLFDRGCLVEIDPQEAMDIVRKTRGMSQATPAARVRQNLKRQQRHIDAGKDLLDYEQFPKWMRGGDAAREHLQPERHPFTGELHHPTEGVSMSDLVAVLLAANKQMDERIKQLEAMQ
jgi:hypothetical protein